MSPEARRMRRMSRANRNFPKCKNCVIRGCHGGEHNHELGPYKRERCSFCSCPAFEELSKKQYKALLPWENVDADQRRDLRSDAIAHSGAQ